MKLKQDLKEISSRRSFTEMLERSINNYKNKSIETAQVIEELISGKENA